MDTGEEKDASSSKGPDAGPTREYCGNSDRWSWPSQRRRDWQRSNRRNRDRQCRQSRRRPSDDLHRRDGPGALETSRRSGGRPGGSTARAHLPAASQAREATTDSRPTDGRNPGPAIGYLGLIEGAPRPLGAGLQSDRPADLQPGGTELDQRQQRRRQHRQPSEQRQPREQWQRRRQWQQPE